MPSMMSISPPAGHRLVALFVQKAGQVEQPSGMCKMSSTYIASAQDSCEVMRILFRPGPVELRMFTSSASMKNTESLTDSETCSTDSDSEKKTRKERTVSQAFLYSFFLAYIVHTAIGRVGISKPDPIVRKKVIANPGIRESEVSAIVTKDDSERQRKSGKEGKSNMHV